MVLWLGMLLHSQSNAGPSKAAVGQLSWSDRGAWSCEGEVFWDDCVCFIGMLSIYLFLYVVWYYWYCYLRCMLLLGWMSILWMSPCCLADVFRWRPFALSQVWHGCSVTSQCCLGFDAEAQFCCMADVESKPSHAATCLKDLRCWNTCMPFILPCLIWFIRIVGSSLQSLHQNSMRQPPPAARQGFTSTHLLKVVPPQVFGLNWILTEVYDGNGSFYAAHRDNEHHVHKGDGRPWVSCLNVFPTIDGSEILRSPVEVGSLSHFLRGF